MNRDGCRPIQRVRELAFMGGNEGNSLVPFGMGFFYTLSESVRGISATKAAAFAGLAPAKFLYSCVTCCNGLNWVAPRNFPPQVIGVGFVFL